MLRTRRKNLNLDNMNIHVINKINVLNNMFNTFILSLGLLNPKITFITEVVWTENDPCKLRILEHMLQYEMQKMDPSYSILFNNFSGIVDLKRKLNMGKEALMFNINGSILGQFNIDPLMNDKKYDIFCDVLNNIAKDILNRGHINLYSDNRLLSVVDIGCSYNLIFADSQYSISKDKVEEFTISSLRRWLKNHLPERRLRRMKLKALKEAFNFFF